MTTTISCSWVKRILLVDLASGAQSYLGLPACCKVKLLLPVYGGQQCINKQTLTLVSTTPCQGTSFSGLGENRIAGWEPAAG